MDDAQMFKGFDDFMTMIGEVDEGDTSAIVERIYEGAYLEGTTMVEWLTRAINLQFVRDCMKKSEHEGVLVWTGEYRNREPVFVHANHLGKRAN